MGKIKNIRLGKLLTKELNYLDLSMEIGLILIKFVKY